MTGKLVLCRESHVASILALHMCQVLKTQIYIQRLRNWEDLTTKSKYKPKHIYISIRYLCITPVVRLWAEMNDDTRVVHYDGLPILELNALVPCVGRQGNLVFLLKMVTIETWISMTRL